MGVVPSEQTNYGTDLSQRRECSRVRVVRLEQGLHSSAVLLAQMHSLLASVGMTARSRLLAS